jgi:glutathione S-transferase
MLKLYYHPLASYCWKVLIAFYENDTPFEPVLVDLMNEAARADYRAISPMLKMPALVDSDRGRTVLESTIVIEYLDAFYPGATRFVPEDPEAALQVRMSDRFYDHYVHTPMQAIVADRLRPAGRNDPFGVEQARSQIREAYGVLANEMDGRTWAAGEEFSLADCAAAPALLYADTIEPFGEADGHLAAYLERLKTRPSFARVLEEAEPWFHMFPMDRKPSIGRRPG